MDGDESKGDEAREMGMSEQSKVEVERKADNR